MIINTTMYRILSASKDTYITNRVIKGARRLNSNVGGAGTLNLYKLYGAAYSGSTPLTELSRILIKFDLTPIHNLITSSLIDITDSSFNCTLKMYDVYGGQSCPSNFDINVYPMSKSWDEGIGRDINLHSDYMAANWLSASFNTTSSTFTTWSISGANSGGIPGTDCDYITSSLLGGASYVSTLRARAFTKGTEDLSIDMTNVITGVLNGNLPDEGFRLSFTPSVEADDRSYFVKRFASRNAYSVAKRPRLVFSYNDSVITDQTSMTFDQTGSIFMYNTVYGSLTYITSGSSVISGTNCCLLKLSTEASGSTYTATFSGSSTSPGIYSATAVIYSTTSQLRPAINQSGSLVFKQIWSSLDETVGYMTGSDITFENSSRSNNQPLYQNYSVKVTGLGAEHQQNTTARLRVYAEDIDDQYTRFKRRMIETPGLTIRNAYYQVRDYITGDIWIPFCVGNNATRLSADALSMYFDLDFSNLPVGGSYTIDIKIVVGGATQIFRDVSPPFRVVKS